MLAVFRLSKKQIALLPDAGASQSSVLLRTEKIKSEKTGGVYVSFFSSQTGKCANAVECMHQAAIFEKMLAFLREGVDFIDTLKTASIVLAVLSWGGFYFSG